MTYRSFVSLGVMLGLATGVAPAMAQSAKPAIAIDVATLIKTTRAVCTRNLEGAECGASQRRLVEAVRRGNATKARRDIGSQQVDALIASLS